MICNTCHGIGEVLIDGAGRIVAQLRDAVMMVPCPEGCIGGISHCCQGENVDCAAEAGERRDRTRTG